ncbi:MAG: DUF1648 domain-containing protein [Thermodesulfobacteriota bacterium]
MKTTKCLLILLAGLAVIQTFYYYYLPDIVVSNFGGRGNPNGWMLKSVFFGFYLIMIALMLFIFLIIPKFPKTLTNIPNKNFWLAAQRRAETMEYVDKTTTLMGIATMLFIIYTFQLVIQANLSTEKILSNNFLFALILYFIFLSVWLFKLLRRFRKITFNYKK